MQTSQTEQLAENFLCVIEIKVAPMISPLCSLLFHFFVTESCACPMNLTTPIREKGGVFLGIFKYLVFLEEEIWAIMGGGNFCA